MEPDRSGHEQEGFDEQLYLFRLTQLSTLAQKSFFTIQEAIDAGHIVTQSVELLRLSCETIHLPQTITLLQTLNRVKETPANRDFSDTITPLFSIVFPAITQEVQAYPNFHLGEGFALALDVFTSQVPERNTLALPFFRKFYDTLLASSLPNSIVRTILKGLIAGDQIEDCLRIVSDQLDSTSALRQRFPKPIDTFLNIHLLGLQRIGRYERLYALIDQMTHGHGKDLITAWEEAIGVIEHKDGMQQVYLEQFAVICELENAYPGICQYLIEQREILIFSYHTFQSLTALYQNSPRSKAPYGLIIPARYRLYEEMHRTKFGLLQFAKQASTDGIETFPAEMQNQPGLLNTIQTFRTESQHPAEYIALLAHGTKAYLMLGYNQQTRYLNLASTTTLREAEIATLRNALVSNGYLLLIGCNYGESDGIAQYVSQNMPDIYVIACEESIHLKDLAYQKDTQTPTRKIQAHFMDEYGGKVPTVVYRNGLVVDKYE